MLRWIIDRKKPKIVHALELQNAGYICLSALSGRKPMGVRLIVTNWGSDIFWFQRFPRHLKKIRDLLKLADAYSAECHRDVSLARKYGFSGVVLPVIPNSGGFATADLEPPLLAPSQRNTIAIKGYHGWVGRAKVALQAVSMLSEELEGQKIVVFSSNWSVVALAYRISKRTGLKIRTRAKGKLSHREMLDLFAESAIYIGLSASDGISTSMLEAMAMGAIPVQSSTSCCNEWFTDTGIAVQNIDIEEVKAAIIAGLALSQNPANAAFNRDVIRSRASMDFVTKKALNFYEV